MIPLMDLGLDGGPQNGIQASERIRYVSRRQGIVLPLTIHDEPVFMPPWIEGQLYYPTATGLFFQRHGRWLPAIEGASHKHRLRIGSIDSNANAPFIGVRKPLEQ